MFVPITSKNSASVLSQAVMAQGVLLRAVLAIAVLSLVVFWDFEDRINVSCASNSIEYAVEGTGISTQICSRSYLHIVLSEGANITQYSIANSDNIAGYSEAGTNIVRFFLASSTRTAWIY
jgi:hypothetical protein